VTYLQLITSHLERNGASAELITVVEDYLEHVHPHQEPPWSQEFDEIFQKAVAFANSKAERLRKHKKRVAAAKAKPAELNSRHRQYKSINSTIRYTAVDTKRYAKLF
jgi:hypothetical protein